MDTLVWLANFPATYGFVFVFIAGFSLFGLLRMAVGGGALTDRALQQLREAAGEATEPTRSTAHKVQAWLYRVVTVLVLAAAVIGIISLITNRPITASYIADRGHTVSGTYDTASRVVSFRADDGREYRIPIQLMTPPTLDGFWPSDGQVEVRYLPSHPQAFVIIPPR